MAGAGQRATTILREWWAVIAFVLVAVYATGQLTSRVTALEDTVSTAVKGAERLSDSISDLKLELLRVRVLLESRRNQDASPTGVP